MAVYRRVFSVADVATVHKAFLGLMTTAEAVELAAARAGRRGAAGGTLRLARSAYAEFNRELDLLARETAANAQKEIQAVLGLRRKRPVGDGPRIRDHIVCRPIRDFGRIATGEVGIADIAILDKVVNPHGPQYGPYWRTIEDGYRGHVGRQVTGAFFGRGQTTGPFAPNPAEFRAHPVFLTRAQRRTLGDSGFGPRGGTSGRRMTIRRPIEAQHFIRDGADKAELAWRAGIGRIEANALRRIAAITRGP